MDMIRRLHRQFILIATGAVVIIVAVALGVINGVIYYRVHDDIHAVMTHIVNNGGTISGTLRPEENRWIFERRWMEDTPEFTYQTRYFSILFDREGTVKRVNVNQIAAFSAQEAMETAVEAARHGQAEGFFQKGKAGYAYVVTSTAEGMLVVILDCTRDLAVVDAVMRYSLLFGFFCILLFIAIVFVLSRWALRPFIRNVENQKRFITNAGHELKTPIAIISANTEAMELINGKSEWTDNILNQVNRLSRLINDLITLVRLGETSPRDVVLTDVNLSEVVRSAVNAFQPMVAEAGKTVALHVEDGVVVKAHTHHFGELANILLDNAVKYCDDGGVITVRLARRKAGRGAVFSVSNNYEAGERVDCSRFFERFYRGDTSHSSQTKGYGIGLSMAEDLVKLMKGRIYAHWSRGIITFTVEIG